jgi:hypothetical protein
MSFNEYITENLQGQDKSNWKGVKKSAEKDRMHLRYVGWEIYEDKQGKHFKWDDKTQKFIILKGKDVTDFNKNNKQASTAFRKYLDNKGSHVDNTKTEEKKSENKQHIDKPLDKKETKVNFENVKEASETLFNHVKGKVDEMKVNDVEKNTILGDIATKIHQHRGDLICNQF